MKAATLKRKNEILKKFNIAELKNLFGKRLDDDLFASVGAMETPIAKQRNQPPHLLAWLGFEILTESLYLQI